VNKFDSVVSFIIPYYNSGSTIQETVDSIFNQSYENFDVWIINDGSTDLFSIEKLKEFENHPKINLLHQENAGPSVARNLALSFAKGQYIVSLDADDKIEYTTLIDSIKIFTLNQKVGVVYGNLQFFGENHKIKIQEEFSLEKQLLWNQIAVCCVIRKKVFEEVGSFDFHLSLLGLEDWEFWLRVGQTSWEFKKVEKVHFNIRVESNSRTFQVANKNIHEIKKYVCQKHALLWVEMYDNLYYQNKMTAEMPDFKIGRIILAPYRFFKHKIFNR
jgi:glycosyltransferase involved in cell wall biosynthesis